MSDSMKNTFNAIGGIIFIFAAIWVLGKCSNGSSSSSNQYPFEQNNERAEYLADMSENDTRDYEQYLYPSETLEPDDPYYSAPAVSASSCPNGCATHINGCDIKGNVGFDSGAKIYHLPGQKFYASTDINPAYGELWFCTEAEAQANGWRKSYQ